MKIKFIKEYVAVAPDTNLGIVHRYRVGETKEIKGYTAQWLIDNGFAEEVKESGWEKPTRGDNCYFINGAGVITSTVWMENSQDRVRYLMGNCFRTTEAAERYRDYLEAIATVRQDEGVLTPEQINELEWRQGKAYHVGYTCKQNGEEVRLIDLYETWAPVGVILFDTEGHANASLGKHPDEWKIIANYDWSRE